MKLLIWHTFQSFGRNSPVCERDKLRRKLVEIGRQLEGKLIILIVVQRVIGAHALGGAVAQPGERCCEWIGIGFEGFETREGPRA